MQKYFLIVKDEYCIADALGTGMTYCPQFEMVQFTADFFDNAILLRCKILKLVTISPKRLLEKLHDMQHLLFVRKTHPIA